MATLEECKLDCAQFIRNALPLIRPKASQLPTIPKDATAGQRSLAEQTCQRDAAAREAVVQAGTAAATSAAASGTSGDSLAACMARIPKDASAGQRMLAEGSCERDEAARQTTQR